MSFFDWAAISGSRRVPWLLCQLPVLYRVAWGAVTEWGSNTARCAMATGEATTRHLPMSEFHPSPVQGAASGEGQLSPRAPPLGLSQIHIYE